VRPSGGGEGRGGPSPRSICRRAGYEDAATEVQQLWLTGHGREPVSRVPDELVLRTKFPGAMVRRRLEAYASAGITAIRVEAAGDTLDHGT
jgi:hypothetical protein